jgi:cobalt/nickel transport system permease protein
MLSLCCLLPAACHASLPAVHIADNILTAPWVLGGFVLAAVLVLGAMLVDGVRGWLGRRGPPEEEIAQTALLTAVFFVASLIHVRVGPTSVHLLLNGLLGVLLGWRAALAIPVGLLLQAVLIQHGGFSTLGINSCIMVLPALLAWLLFAALQRLPWGCHPFFRTGLVALCVLGWLLSLTFSVALLVTNPLGQVETLETARAVAVLLHPLTLILALVLAGLAAWAERRLENAPEFPLGLLVGGVSVLATLLLNCLVLLAGGQEDWHALVLLVLVAHLPVAVVEGVVTGFTVGFLVRVKPELLGWVPTKETPCPADSTS